jgi:hypothetical protein
MVEGGRRKEGIIVIVDHRPSTTIVRFASLRFASLVDVTDGVYDA